MRRSRQAYAVEGARDRSRPWRSRRCGGVRGGGAGAARDDEPPRPHRGRDRHRQDEDLQGIAEQLSRSRGARLRRRREGRPLRARAPRCADGPAPERMAELGPRLRAARLPGRVPLARRHRPGRARPRDRHRLRPAAAREGARGERDAGAEPRARLSASPTRAASRCSISPTCARCSPTSTRTQGKDVAQGHRRRVLRDDRRAAARARRGRGRRRHGVLRRAPARTMRRSAPDGARRTRDRLVPRAAGRPGQAATLVDGAHVAARRALRGAAGGRRSRASRSSSSSSTRRTCSSRRDRGVPRLGRDRPCA